MKIIKFQHKESTYGFVSSKKKSETFVCDYCHKKYKTQSGLIKHSAKCDIRERFSLQESPTSKLAHILWIESFKGSSRKKFDFKTFADHSEYNFFMKLSTFCITLNIDDPISYMNWCCDNKIKGIFWTLESNFEKYIKQFIVHEEPMAALKRSVQYISNISNLNISEFFSTVKSGILLNMLQCGRISPWIVILANNFCWDPLKHFNREQEAMYSGIVLSRIWHVLLKKHKEQIPELIEYLAKQVETKENI